SIDGLYLKNAEQHRAIKQALFAGSAAGARALAREHVLSSFHLLETILEQVGAQPRDWQKSRGVQKLVSVQDPAEVFGLVAVGVGALLNDIRRRFPDEREKREVEPRSGSS